MRCESILVKKVWGYEEIPVNSELYCFKFLKLEKGFCCSLHHHKLKTETFYLLSGLILLEHKQQIFPMMENAFVTILPNEDHRFFGIEKSIILEVSTQDFPEDSYRLTESSPFDLNKFKNYLWINQL